MEFIDSLTWTHIIVFCATIGLAPFSPPHIYEKTVMLLNGRLKRPLDIFDFFFHAWPWALLVIKAALSFR